MSSLKRYSCDFETTTKKEDCRVWAFACVEIGNLENLYYGNNIDTFLKWCQKESKICYFHNLKFDGSFILNRILQLGFQYSSSKEPNTFSTLITKEGIFYEIEIYFEKTKVTFYDSLKMLPFSAKKIAEDYHLPIAKLDLNYTKEREVGYQLTEEEKEYLFHDVKIIAMALEILFQEGFTHITTASNAFHYYENLISKDVFSKVFPLLEPVMDDYIRKSYRGGFVYVNPKKQNRIIRNGQVYDVNSLYPTIMYYYPLPIKEPVYFQGKYQKNEKYPLYIQHIVCDIVLKKDYLPTIQIKKNPLYVSTEYIERTNGLTDLYLTNVDLDLMLDHYHILEITYLDGFMFQSERGLFKNYIDHFMEIKKKEKGAKRSIAKLMLNSLYGRFATSRDATKKIPFLEEDTLKFKLGEKEEKDSVYTALAVFVTAWARNKTIRTAQNVYDRFCYADTDSIHIEGLEDPNIKIDEKELGYWKKECVFTRAKFLHAKCYIEEIEGSLNVKCAGMPDSVKQNVTFENFKKGFTSSGKLVPKQVKGGVVLIDSPFTIK